MNNITLTIRRTSKKWYGKCTYNGEVFHTAVEVSDDTLTKLIIAMGEKINDSFVVFNLHYKNG